MSDIDIRIFVTLVVIPTIITLILFAFVHSTLNFIKNMYNYYLEDQKEFNKNMESEDLE